MNKSYKNEIWKEVYFDFEYTNQIKIEVSNYGRVRSFHKNADGNILKGSLTNGYRFIRLKFFKPRSAETQKSIDLLQKKIVTLSKKIKSFKLTGEDEIIIKDAIQLQQSLKQKLKTKYATDVKSRTIYWHAAVHRLVASAFLEKPTIEHTIVGHLNFDKENNSTKNLKWMTPQQNYKHQQKSPFVIEDRQKQLFQKRQKSKATKLTVTRVMLLKKMLEQQKPMEYLVKIFKVSATQINRIKKGENWKDIEV